MNPIIIWDLDEDEDGNTTDGRFIVVIYELIDEETVYPITAFEVPELREKRTWPNT